MKMIQHYPPRTTPTPKPHLRPFKLPPNLDKDCVLALFPERNNKWLDRSGKGNHGTIHGATWKSKGTQGTALYFNGVDDYVEVQDNANLRFGLNNFTIEIWVYDSGAGTVHKSMISKGDAGASEWYIFRGRTDNLRTYCGRGKIAIVEVALFPKHSWQHVALVRNGALATLYRNAKVVGTDSTSDLANLTTTKKIAIGAGEEGSGAYWKGMIDQARIYNRALSALQIKQLYNFTKTTN